MKDTPELLSPGVSIEEALRKAEEDSLVVRHPKPGGLRLSGDSSLDLLNRMSSNKILDMSPMTIRESVLTTAHAKIIDSIWIIRHDDDLTVLTGPGRSETVSNWLQQHIFFQDDVRISSIGDDLELVGIYGPGAEKIFSKNFNHQAPTGEEVTTIEAVRSWAVTKPIPGFHLLIEQSNQEIWNLIAGHITDPEISSHTYEILRIRASCPQSPNEINESYIPLEVGLWDAVSFSKGCYTGQEIIARMESRGKLARQLVRLHLSAQVPLGSSIFQGKRNLGLLTSIIHSPVDGWIGLGVIKPIAVEGNEDTLSIGSSAIQAQIVEFV